MDGQDTVWDPTFDHMAMLRTLLIPFSWLYELVLIIRHWLYDIGFLSSEEVPIRTVILGNLELGGTGKSPHTMWIIKHMDHTQCAILSRGYGRETKGLKEVQKDSRTSEVGDEPLMMKKEFPQLEVVVSEDRVKGIRYLAEKGLSTVILDDALQHRKLKGGFRILITAYDQPFTRNSLLPAGSLRDIKRRAEAADVIIVSKCPYDLTDDQCKSLSKEVKRYSSARVYFSQMIYGKPERIDGRKENLEKGSPVLAISALAHNDAFQFQVGKEYDVKEVLGFSDHHRYTAQDLRKVKSILSTFAGLQMAVLTTAKDAVKLSEAGWVEALGIVPIYVLPSEVRILKQEPQLLEQLNAYVRTNQRDQ